VAKQWKENSADFTMNCDTCMKKLQKDDTTWELWFGNPDTNQKEQTPRTTTCDEQRCRDEGERRHKWSRR